MAVSNKNLVITPNIGSTSDDPKIVFSGADASTSNQDITLRIYPTSNGTLSFEGSAGQLFSITNSMSGTIYSVNDISGMPSIEVLDTGLIKIGQYSGNVLLGTGSDNGIDKLQVSGTILGTTIKGTTLTSTVATGTAPLTVSSTTVVTNLNADMWDGYHFSSYLNQGVRTDSSVTFAEVYNNGWFRNNTTKLGLYSQVNGNHWYSDAATYWNATFAGNAGGGIRLRTSHDGQICGYFYADSSNNVGFLDSSGSWALQCVGSSYVLANGASMRAKIFYDSDDTTYYIDPNGTSKISKSYIQSYSNTGYIAFNNNSTYWGLIGNYAANDWRLGYGDVSSLIGWGMRWDSGGVAWSNASHRAPIFYDSDNTAYYLDPASTSNLNGLITNSQTILGGQIYVSGTNTNTLNSGYTTNGNADIWINYRGYNDGFTQFRDCNIGDGKGGNILWAGGSSKTVGINTGQSASATLHVRASTPTTIGAVPSGTVGIFDSNSNNYLLFRNTADNSTYSGLVFQDNNIGGYVVFGNAGVGDSLYIAGYSGGQLQYGTADSISPGARTTVASWNSTGLQVNNGDFRAPIYYDSNNTSYYADLNSTTTSINSCGSIYCGNGSADTGIGIYHGNGSGDYGRIRFYRAGTNDQTIHVFPTTWQGGTLASTSSGAINLTGASGVTFGNWNSVAGYIGNGGDLWVGNNVKAPIYYDSNDTNYYVDPASNSRLSGLYVAGYSIRRSWTWDLSSLDQSTYFPCIIQLPQNGQPIRNTIHVGLNSGTLPTWSTHSSGFSVMLDWTTNGSGWGTINVLRTIHNKTYSFATVDPVGGLTQMNNSSYEVVYLRGGGKYYFVSNGDVTNIGIKTTTFTNAGQSVSPSTSQLNDARVQFTGSTNAGMNVYRIEADESLRAPIFYDSNDTNYYVDPNGTSSFNNMYVYGGFGGVSNSSVYTEAALEIRERGFGGAQDDTWATAPRIGFHWGGRIASQIALASSGRISILNNPGNAVEAFQCGNLYAPILYDIDNNAYYCDPASTSNLNNVNAVLFTSTSDKSKKENIEPIQNALEKVISIRGVTFDWKDTKQRSMGVIAQEVIPVIPEVVHGEEGSYTVSYDNLVGVLIEAIKEQNVRINKQQDQIDQLISVVNNFLK